ncbi:MAG: RluA family pseudouridine synthase [Bdellovibrionaceae bacterium]|nr:RluA family pseudouridine synthase [Pseudobdellovibrionaceae bacterium]
MPGANEKISRTVAADGDGLRLDKWLSTWPEISSRSRASQLIDETRVAVNGRPAKSSSPVKEGDCVVVDFPEEKPVGLLPHDLDLEILFEDDDVLVVNKPSGLVVHPAAGHEADTLVNVLVGKIKNFSMGFGEERPGIVHRLDKETSGLLVVAKNDFAQEKLVAQFKERRIHRLYQAVCFGELRKESGKIQSWLARHPVDRKRFASVPGKDRKILRHQEDPPSAGKWAVTHYRRLSRHHGLSFVELKLETGRTHQIRVHLSEEGHPLVGDALYGADRRLKGLSSVKLRERIRALPRFLLHARTLGFAHPRSGEWKQFEVEWPAADLLLLQEWGFLP